MPMQPGSQVIQHAVLSRESPATPQFTCSPPKPRRTTASASSNPPGTPREGRLPYSQSVRRIMTCPEISLALAGNSPAPRQIGAAAVWSALLLGLE
ncbi:hypothetical protein LZ30DRAFT_309220 [Colletotrichum cereale]|nr:hypothetical protein LZ30DRAFT_309220 [Colletotrichum cereale]